MGGETAKSPEETKKEIVDFYQNLYSQPKTWRSSGGCREGHKIFEKDNLMLQGNLGTRRYWIV